MPTFKPETFKVNEDGSFSIDLDGRATRLVKESDLLTVKGSSESARAELESKIASHQTEVSKAKESAESIRQQLLQEQAAKEQLRVKAEESDTLRGRVGELEQTVASHKTAREELEKELLGVKRGIFINQYKVDQKKVNEMDLSQLREAEKVIQTIGFNPNPKPASYDGGGSGGGASVPSSPIEQAKAELKFVREQQSRKAAGG